MNPNFDKYLCLKYPKIFADRHAPMNQTCMCWGFEHGDGWFLLLDALCADIQNRIDNPPYVYKKTLKVYASRVWNWVVLKLHLPYRFLYYGEVMERGFVPQLVAVQVKEKFGGLRFYSRGGDAYTQAIIDFAETLSYRICETCGVMNELVNPNSRGWIQTTCPCCARDKESHTDNRRTELVELFRKVMEDNQNDASK